MISKLKAIRLALQISGNAKSASPRFRAKCARPLSNLKAGSGNETILSLPVCKQLAGQFEEGYYECTVAGHEKKAWKAQMN